MQVHPRAAGMKNQLRYAVLTEPVADWREQISFSPPPEWVAPPMPSGVMSGLIAAADSSPLVAVWSVLSPPIRCAEWGFALLLIAGSERDAPDFLWGLVSSLNLVRGSPERQAKLAAARPRREGKEERKRGDIGPASWKMIWTDGPRNIEPGNNLAIAAQFNILHSSQK